VEAKAGVFVLSIVFAFRPQGTIIGSSRKKQQHVVVSLCRYKGMQINNGSCSGNIKTIRKTVIGCALSTTVHLEPLWDRISTVVQNLNRC
jgi:hypothetical protein